MQFLHICDHFIGITLTDIFLFQYYFSMFLHKSETFMLMEQLTNLAVKQ
jgi:hypothetical protein